MNRRLHRCRHDRVLAGVAGGVAEYFDVDPTLVRILWIVSVFFGGLGLVLYVIMAFIVPQEPEFAMAGGGFGGAAFAGAGGPVGSAGPGGEPGEPGEAPPEGATAAWPQDWHAAYATHGSRPRGTGRLTTFVGFALILFGALALVDAFLPAWIDSGRYLWPAFVVGIGVLLVAGAVRREATES